MATEGNTDTKLRLVDLISSGHTSTPIKSDAPVATTQGTSSFRMSNKLPTLLSKPAKQTNTGRKEDIMLHYRKKIKHFTDLRNSRLPELRRKLERCRSPTERQALEDEIKAIETREDEADFLFTTFGLMKEYADVTKAEDKSHENKTEKDDEERGKSMRITEVVRRCENVQERRVREEYFRITDPQKVSYKSLVFDDNSCGACKGQLVTHNGRWTCSECGLESPKMVSDLQPGYRDMQETQYKSNFAYKRGNRFKEMLSTVQAKETTEIPQGVIDAVRHEARKERVTEIEELDIARVKSYLKRTGYNKYYDHAPFIIRSISGKPPMVITRETENKLIEMFNQIQEPFERVKARVQPERKSFLSYTFVFSKFFEVLGQYDKLQFFSQLKSNDKLRVQDQIWKGICEELGWTYKRSM